MQTFLLILRMPSYEFYAHNRNYEPCFIIVQILIHFSCVSKWTNVKRYITWRQLSGSFLLQFKGLFCDALHWKKYQIKARNSWLTVLVKLVIKSVKLTPFLSWVSHVEIGWSCVTQITIISYPIRRKGMFRQVPSVSSVRLGLL